MFHGGRPTAEAIDGALLEELERALGARRPDIVPALRERAKADPGQAQELGGEILRHARAPQGADTDTTLEFYSEILRVLNLEHG